MFSPENVSYLAIPRHCHQSLTHYTLYALLSHTIMDRGKSGSTNLVSRYDQRNPDGPEPNSSHDLSNQSVEVWYANTGLPKLHHLNYFQTNSLYLPTQINSLLPYTHPTTENQDIDIETNYEEFRQGVFESVL